MYLHFNLDVIEVTQEIQDPIDVGEDIHASFIENSNEHFNVLKESVGEYIVDQPQEDIDNINNVVQKERSFSFNENCDKNEELLQANNVLQSYFIEPDTKKSKINPYTISLGM